MERDTAYQILTQNVFDKNLIKHSLAVEAGMRKLAMHFKEDVEKWGMVGLLHDVDYEKTKEEPSKHGIVSLDILKDSGLDEESLLAIKSHNEMTGEKRETLISKALFSLDQLTGLIVASVLVLPSRNIKDLVVDSVLKKFKEKSFAKAVKRENILLCKVALDITIEKFVEMIIEAMQGICEELGL